MSFQRRVSYPGLAPVVGRYKPERARRENKRIQMHSFEVPSPTTTTNLQTGQSALSRMPLVVLLNIPPGYSEVGTVGGTSEYHLPVKLDTKPQICTCLMLAAGPETDHSCMFNLTHTCALALRYRGVVDAVE